jgi:ArsR family transcriptional regulator
MIYNQEMAQKALPVVREKGVCCVLPAVDAQWAERTASLMKALSDPARATMLAALWKSTSPVCICDFTAGLGLTQSTISHHMAKLVRAGLVTSEKRGIWMYYRLRDDIEPARRTILGRLIATG